jgi:hypothetical protein
LGIESKLDRAAEKQFCGAVAGWGKTARGHFNKALKLHANL